MVFWSKITRQLAALGMVPRSRLAFLTLYLAGTDLFLLLLQSFLRFVSATKAASALTDWITFLGWMVFLLLIVVGIRWFRNHVMWSVRNRLIVTYLFIGGLPVTLVAAMAIGTGFVVVDHLATFLAVSEIQAQQQHLSALNAAAVEEIVRHSSTVEKITTADTTFPGRSIMFVPPGSVPSWVKDGFAGLVIDHRQLDLRAANMANTVHGPMMVISSVPFDQKLLARVASKLGALTITSDFDSSDFQITTKDGLEIKTPKDPEPTLQKNHFQKRISAGTVAEPRRGLDREIGFGGLIQATDWQTGESKASLFLTGSTRISTILASLTASMGIWSGIVGVFLIAAAITFAIVVLVALLIGMGLTRKITYSVANLYKATQHINRGDFTHRIQVREKDQLAALQVSFNSMTENLQRLIEEQKEKERLQSELEIAHEVQAQLFPRNVSGTSTLEVHGICRPARIVSGDYYDFLAYGPHQIGIAVGDISGKGISAALLMATIHSAVRAYEQEQLLSVSTAAAYGTNTRIAAVEAQVVPASPAQMLWLLNRHLFQSTQPEKYATLFLGFYDDIKRRLTFSNAGHLPPIVLSTDGTVRRLETGGTVVGLFPDCDYEEQTVDLYQGDIFIAFSDGITEPENEFGEFGEERLIEIISTYRHLPLERITEHVISAIQDWIGSTEQPDDITLVLARRS